MSRCFGFVSKKMHKNSKKLAKNSHLHHLFRIGDFNYLLSLSINKFLRKRFLSNNN